jgi:hypothetical protein
VLAYVLARNLAIDPGHQQLVVSSVLMSNGSCDGQLDRPRIERPTRGGAAYPSAATGRGASGDLLRTRCWATREQPRDLARHPFLQIEILLRTPRGLSRPPARPRFLVGETRRLGLIERVLLDEDSLPLITPARAAEANHDCPQATAGLRAPGQRRVARRQIHEMV